MQDRASPKPMAAAGSPGGSDRRILTLDGLRGAATIMVVVSHFFGEVQHGLRAAMFGWIGVDIFFVLSGFLIGKLILERRRHDNFFLVFYVRRCCRILPVYLLTLIAVTLLIDVLPAAWTDASVRFPLWSYLTFVQGVFMVMTQSIGAHWLAPTWTLAVEEHFYLLVPAMIVFTPRRWLVPALIGAGLSAIGLRAAVAYGGLGNPMVALALLPGRADIIVCGLLAAVAIKNDRIDWSRYTLGLRVTPIAAMIVAFALRAVSSRLFDVFAPLVMAVGCTAFLLCLVHETPEAKRFKSRVLRFFGDNGYCLYLIHLPILGMMHGLILGARPDLTTPAQWIVTLASLPVCVLFGWGMTKLIEEPLTRYGRSWRWSPSARTAAIEPIANPNSARQG
jgi:peptidoglycan/LPS O-acetylase OafA/YrhL